MPFVMRMSNLAFLGRNFHVSYQCARLLGLPRAGLITIIQVSVSYAVLRTAGFAKTAVFTVMWVTFSPTPGNANWLADGVSGYQEWVGSVWNI